MQAKWTESFTQFNVAAVDDWTVVEKESAEGKTTAKQPAQQPKKAVEGAKRGLRRKLDDNDIKMKQLKLDSMEQFKEHVLVHNEDQFLEVSSQREILAIKGLFEKRSFGRQ